MNIILSTDKNGEMPMTVIWAAINTFISVHKHMLKSRKQNFSLVALLHKLKTKQN